MIINKLYGKTYFFGVLKFLYFLHPKQKKAPEGAFKFNNLGVIPGPPHNQQLTLHQSAQSNLDALRHF
jgi:hypothetical protein